MLNIDKDTNNSYPNKHQSRFTNICNALNCNNHPTEKITIKVTGSVSNYLLTINVCSNCKGKFSDY